jgi:hypothetical protein
MVLRVVDVPRCRIFWFFATAGGVLLHFFYYILILFYATFASCEENYLLSFIDARGPVLSPGPLDRTSFLIF